RRRAAREPDHAGDGAASRLQDRARRGRSAGGAGGLRIGEWQIANGGSFVFSLIPPRAIRHSPHCSGGSPGTLLLASSTSVTATRTSARVFRSGASSKACFSAGP